jgi:WD40 repeat protein
VTGICCGVGGISGRIFTCSLDRTVRVYDIAANCQVASFVLPVALHALALDAAETYAYAAGVDGRLFQIDLLAHARGVAVASNQNELPVYIRALIGHSKTATALSLSLDDLTLISSSLDGL